MIDRQPSPDSAPHVGRRRLMTGTAAGVAASALVACKPSEVTYPFALDLRDHFGAVGDGRTDDTEAVRRAFGEFSGHRGGPAAGLDGGRLHVPPGEYRLTSTVAVHRFAGVVEGTGIANTPNYSSGRSAGRGACFTWDGPVGEPMFRVTDSAFVAFRDLRFGGHDERPPSAALNFRSVEGADSGSNANLVVEDCVFGRHPWTTRGTHKGLMRNGILFDGNNENNDQFFISRCVVNGRRSLSGSAGIRIEGTQSIWGSIRDCVLNGTAIGISTAASTTIDNGQFNRCGTDLYLTSTAKVELRGWNSEKSHRLARVGPHASLHATGGVAQLMVAGPGRLVDAFPSGAGQTVVLREMRFSKRPPTGAPQPTLRFGPAPPQSCGGPGFLVKIEDCVGIDADQCEFAGSMWASVPDSRGIVEWQSRAAGLTRFRNELWAKATPGTRTTVDVNVWDPPRAGTH